MKSLFSHTDADTHRHQILKKGKNRNKITHFFSKKQHFATKTTKFRTFYHTNFTFFQSLFCRPTTLSLQNICIIQ